MPQLAAVLLALVSQVDAPGLEPGRGRDEVRAACTICHTVEIIASSHMSRKTWDTTITWMQETQGLAELDPDLRSVILDYLAATQGLEEETDASSPWASPLYRPNPLW